MKNENFHFLKKLKKIFEIHFTSIKLETFANTPKEDFGMTVLVSEKREIFFFKLRKLRFFCTFSKKLEKKPKLVNYKPKNFVGSPPKFFFL